MNEPADDELRARFEQLRDDDLARVPSFRASWDRAELRARTPRRGPGRALLWLAAAASVVLTVSVALREPGVREPARVAADSTPPEANVTPSISTWRSPTAGLLRTSGRDLLAPPSLLSSILGGVAPAPAQRKGA